MMIGYVAFIRGINVGGRNLLKMQDVRQLFSSLGLVSVSSFKASGNILFQTDNERDKTLSKIRESISDLSGQELEVFLREESELKEIIELDPFKGRGTDFSKMYVTLVPDGSPTGLELPLWSKNKDVEIFRTRQGEVFSQTFLYRGRYGAPNGLVEKILDVPATTRNWNTIRGIHDKLVQN